VHQFATDREALDFLVGRIAVEAKREDVPLSDIERKILYFSETGWTLPDMAAVSATFDQNYDQGEYEQKVARLIAKISAEHHGHNKEEEEKWDAAALKLSEGDHYIQVLLNVTSSIHDGPPAGHGFIPSLNPPAVRPPYDRLKLLVVAMLVLFAALLLTLFKNWLTGR